MNAQETIEERELERALAPERPEPDAFREAVRRRIAEREAAGEEAGAPEPLEMREGPFLRRAAAILPPGFLPATALMAGKKAGFKALWPLLASPALLVTMALITAFVCLRALRKPAASSGKPVDRRTLAETIGWWSANPQVVFLGLAPLILVGVLRGPFGLAVVLILSMLALVVIVQRLSRAGLAHRGVVVAQSAQVLVMMVWGISLVEQVSPTAVRSALAAMGAGILGAGLCGYLALPPRIPGLGPRRIVLLIALIAVWPISIPFYLFSNQSRVGVPREELVEVVEAFDESTERIARWKEFAQLAAWLRTTGEDELDLSRARASLWVGLEAESRGGKSVNRYMLSSAIHAGLLDEGLAERLATSSRAERTLFLADRGTAPLLLLPWIRALIHLDRLEDDLRALALRQAVERWHEVADEPGALDELAVVRRWVELLGGSAELERLDERERELLVELWVPFLEERSTPSGGFARVRQMRDEHGADRSGTWHGLALLERHGVPEEIDIEELRTYLRGEARLPRGELRSHRLLPCASLLRFEERFPDSSPAYSRFLESHGLLVGILLVVGLCAYATLQAPHRAVPKA